MEPIIASIIGGLIVSIVSGGIFALLRRKWQKSDDRTVQDKKEKEAIVTLQKSIWRLNKTVLIMARMLDEQVEKSHPELTSTLEDIASELLRETKD